MNSNNSTQVYLAVENLINKRCHYFSRHYHVEFDDVKSQANIIFMESLARYNGSVKFSTYLYTRLNQLHDHYRTLIRHNQLYTQRIPFTMSIEPISKLDDRLAFENFLTALSKDSKQILRILTTTNGYVSEKPKKYEIQRLLARQGWSKRRIERAWENVKAWWQSVQPVLVS